MSPKTTGDADDTGRGKGLGATLNVPVKFGTPRKDYFARFQAGLEKMAGHMKPQLVLISAGFDAHRDDPVGSLLWLPLYEALDREDSLYRRSVRAVSEDTGALLPQLARLLGPDATEVLAWLRRAPLDNGVAAEFVDDTGRAVANGGDAALAGLLAHTLWYAAHALGLRG